MKDRKTANSKSLSVCGRKNWLSTAKRRDTDLVIEKLMTRKYKRRSACLPDLRCSLMSNVHSLVGATKMFQGITPNVVWQKHAVFLPVKRSWRAPMWTKVSYDVKSQQIIKPTAVIWLIMATNPISPRTPFTMILVFIACPSLSEETQDRVGAAIRLAASPTMGIQISSRLAMSPKERQRVFKIMERGTFIVVSSPRLLPVSRSCPVIDFRKGLFSLVLLVS